MEGRDVADFWIRFEVLNVNGELVDNENNNLDTKTQTDTEYSSAGESDQDLSKVSVRPSIKKKASKKIVRRMSLRRKNKRERSKTEAYYSITPEMSKMISAQKFASTEAVSVLDEPTEKLLEIHSDLKRSRSNPNSLDDLGTNPSISNLKSSRKPKEKKNIAKTATC